MSTRCDVHAKQTRSPHANSQFVCVFLRRFVCAWFFVCWLLLALWLLVLVFLLFWLLWLLLLWWLCIAVCVCHSKQVGSNIAILSFCCYYCYSSLLLVILFYYYSCFIMQYARSRFLSLELYRNRLELWCLRFSAINLRFYAIELRFEAQNALLGPNTRF